MKADAELVELLLNILDAVLTLLILAIVVAVNELDASTLGVVLGGLIMEVDDTGEVGDLGEVGGMGDFCENELFGECEIDDLGDNDNEGLGERDVLGDKGDFGVDKGVCVGVRGSSVTVAGWAVTGPSCGTGDIGELGS